MKIRDKIYRRVNDSFTDTFKNAFRSKFEFDIETSFNIFSGSLVTRKPDGTDFTPEQMTWMNAFEDGYVAAMAIAGQPL